MASLTIKDIPDEVMADLRRAAEIERRSLTQEAIVAIQERAREVVIREERLASLRLVSEHRRARPRLDVTGAELIREAREER